MVLSVRKTEVNPSTDRAVFNRGQVFSTLYLNGKLGGFDSDGLFGL